MIHVKPRQGLILVLHELLLVPVVHLLQLQMHRDPAVLEPGLEQLHAH